MQTIAFLEAQRFHTDYCQQLLQEVKMQHVDALKLKMEDKPYNSLIGSLLYASISTRPDISHAVNVLSRFLKNPGEKHWIAGKRVLRYLKGTTSFGLKYDGKTNYDDQFKITAFTDADWAGDINDRKSTTGFIIKINECVINWISKKQSTVALSTAEAEYMSISAAIQEVIWINQLMNELGFNVIKPMIVYSDNQSAIAMSNNDVHHNRTKHIDIRHHFIRDIIKQGNVTLDWISTQDQVADILTKPLVSTLFEKLRNQIMMKSNV